MDKRTKYAVITMDVESFSEVDCFKRSQIECDIDMYDGLENFIDILDRNKVPATLFVVSNTLHALRERLSAYAKCGHRIALHGFNHTPPYLASNDEFRRTTLWAKHSIEDACGVGVSGYRAPYFGLNRVKLDILREIGFSYDSSQMDFALAEKNQDIDLSGFQRIGDLVYEKDGFYEFKMGCHNFFGHKYPVSGGAYLRLCVWNLMKIALKQHLEQSDLYIFYAHPFEMSRRKLPDYRNMSITDRMYLNVGRMSYCKRLDEIIRMLRFEGFEFITLDDLHAKYEQDKILSAKTIRSNEL